VTSQQLTTEDTFLVLACDGIWDVMTRWAAVRGREETWVKAESRLTAELTDEELLLLSYTQPPCGSSPSKPAFAN
jgi:hypothetical protein